MDRPELCDRCKQAMSELWFQKKDDFEDVNICIMCYEKEYGFWDTGEDEDTPIRDIEED